LEAIGTLPEEVQKVRDGNESDNGKSDVTEWREGEGGRCVADAGGPTPEILR